MKNCHYIVKLVFIWSVFIFRLEFCKFFSYFRAIRYLFYFFIKGIDYEYEERLQIWYLPP
jgi:hypothetical protein